MVATPLPSKSAMPRERTSFASAGVHGIDVINHDTDVYAARAWVRQCGAGLQAEKRLVRKQEFDLAARDDRKVVGRSLLGLGAHERES